MKQVFLCVFAAGAVLLASCSKEDVTASQDGSAGVVTFNAQLPEGLATRAIGDGTTATTLSYAVYAHDEKTPLITSEDEVTFTDLKATVTLRLAVNKSYDVIFWADAPESPYTVDFAAQKVTVDYAAALSNDEKRDAFYKVVEVETSAPVNENIVLNRPFAQINIGTNDTAEAAKAGLVVEKTKVNVKAYSTLNLMDGSVADQTDVVFGLNALPADPAQFTVTGKGTYDYLAMNYLLVGEDKELVDCEFTVNDGAADIRTMTVTGVPVQRNYRTNIFGSLLTTSADFDVTIEPAFTKPDHDYDELLLAAQNGGAVTLAGDVAIEEPLVVAPGKTMTVDLNGHDIVNTTSLPDADPRYGNTTVFEVSGNGTLNIKGDGKIQAISEEPNQDGYRMAVYARGNSTVNIYGGDFFNDQDYNDHNAQLDLIYAADAAVINIYGGRFESGSANSRGYWVLNLQDNTEAAINVYGGTFVNFDPSSSMTENPVKNFVAEGYTSVKISDEPTPNGTYEVIKEGEQVSVPVEVNNAESLLVALSNPAVPNIEVAASIDLSEKSAEELTFEEHKTIDIKKGATLQLGNANWLTAEKGLTLTGKGTIDNTSEDNSDLGNGYQKSLIHVTGGDCVVDGVTLINDRDYHWHGSSATGHPYNSAAIAYWNDANVTIRNARIISGEFTICGMGRDVASGEITLTDSYFESTSSYQDNKMHYAYAMRLYGSKVRIDNCEVKGIQGGVSIESCQDAVISGGKYYTVNTPGAKDAYYPLYITNGAKVTITGGEFSAANDRSDGLAIEGTSAVVSGDNDVNLPTGSVILQGGKFSGKAYNHVTKVVYEPAEGYKWQAIEGAGDQPGDLKWEVVAE